MVNQQLLIFIKEQLQEGVDKELISKELLANDWTMQDIAEGFDAVKKEKIIGVNRENLKTSQDQLNQIQEFVNVGKKTISDIYKQGSGCTK